MINEKSIFKDYFHYYSDNGFITKSKIFLKAFCLPNDPANKICPWIRMELKAYQKGNLFVEKWCESILYKKFMCMIGSHCEIGNNITFPHPLGIVIGHGVKIGDNCVIYHQVTLGQSKNNFPCIGDDVVIFAGAKIVGNVRVGNKVIIGTNAVVVTDIPPNSVVAGNPAVVVKKISDMSEYRAW